MNTMEAKITLCTVAKGEIAIEIVELNGEKGPKTYLGAQTDLRYLQLAAGLDPDTTIFYNPPTAIAAIATLQPYIIGTQGVQYWQNPFLSQVDPNTLVQIQIPDIYKHFSGQPSLF
jgi:hypothetical protein